MTIVGYRMQYELSDGSSISFEWKKRNFPHLLGLQKLVDIPLISNFNDPQNLTVSAGFLISRIKSERFLTEKIIRSSIYFPDIQERYEKFSRENLLTLSYTDVIVNFNPQLIGSVLNSKYILFEKRAAGYDYLGIAKDRSGRAYVETFFYNPTDIYIRNQKVLPITSLKIFDKQGNLYLEDIFADKKIS